MSVALLSTVNYFATKLISNTRAEEPEPLPDDPQTPIIFPIFSNGFSMVSNIPRVCDNQLALIEVRMDIYQQEEKDGLTENSVIVETPYANSYVEPWQYSNDAGYTVYDYSDDSFSSITTDMEDPNNVKFTQYDHGSSPYIGCPTDFDAEEMNAYLAMAGINSLGNNQYYNLYINIVSE